MGIDRIAQNIIKNKENEIAIYFANAFWSRVEKSRKSDPPGLRQVGSRLSAVAFFTFLLSLEKVTKKCQKNTQNCYPGPWKVIHDLTLSGF